MASILSRLLTADKPWTAPYMVSTPAQRPVYQQTVVPQQTVPQQQHNVVSGNEFPQVPSKRRKTSKKTLDSPVRFGRVPKREKAKILAAMQKVNASSQEKALGVELEDELRLLTTIVRAHEETCDYTKDKVIGLVEKARSQPVYTHCPTQLACPLNPAPHILENGVNHYMEDFSERFAPAIKGVVEFAKRIPGFGFLSQDDQVTLLKAGVFEVLLVRLACMFDAAANSLICLNGQVLRRESLHSASNARFLLDSMFDFAERLNTLHLSDSEVGLFCAVVVIAADRPGLRNTDLVLKVQKKLMDILQKSVSANHPENPALFGDLMKKIPDLRTLNTLHSEKLLAYKMEPRNNNNNIHHHVIWSQYSLAPQDEDLRSNSPGQHSQHGGSTTGSEWSTTDSKDDLVGSPRSVGSSLCVEDVKSPSRSASFSSSRSYPNEEGWTSNEAGNAPMYGLIIKNPGSEHGSSSGDEGYFVDSPVKGGPIYPRLRRVDSPTDSGIESGKEHSGPSTTPTISVCSSPVEEKHQELSSIEDMPVLKRALQAPPLVPPHALMDEAYRHHKKFRAARREAESPSNQVSLASTHSTLARTLEQAPRYLSEQQLKRTDLIHNIIMQKETVQQPQIHHSQTEYPFNNNSSNSNIPSSYGNSTSPTHKPQNMLVCPNGYYSSGQPQQSQAPVYSPVSWPFPQQTVNPVQVQYESVSSPNSNFCSSTSVVTSRAGSPPRLLYAATSTSPLVMNGHCPSPPQQQQQMDDSAPAASSSKPSGETSTQPLNLSKKLFSPPPMLKMES